MRFHRLSKFTVLFGLLALAGCEPKKSDTELLMERATAYWEAARLFDLVTMYDMEMAARDGRYLAADAAEAFSGPNRVLKYQLSNPQVDGNSGTVELALTLVMTKYGGKGYDLNPSQDKWTKVDGVWYHGLTKEQAEQAAKAVAKPASPSTPSTDNSLKPQVSPPAVPESTPPAAMPKASGT